jgi:hypothetical protein
VLKDNVGGWVQGLGRCDWLAPATHRQKTYRLRCQAIRPINMAAGGSIDELIELATHSILS